jgi:phosphatidylethanolamine/phosphatidyl-N-methylethanolamine N-methyltransferase
MSKQQCTLAVSVASERDIQALENRLFLKQWFKNPKQLGTLAPISTALADAAAACLTHKEGPIVEIGAGTGRLTRAILRQASPGQKLALVELDAPMCTFLRETLPHVTKQMPAVIHGDAAQLPSLLPAEFKGHTHTVFSAVPLMYLPQTVRDRIIDACFAIMPPQGRIIHVTYSPRSPLAHRTDVQQKRLRSLWVNLPPGCVWEFTQAPSKGM